MDTKSDGGGEEYGLSDDELRVLPTVYRPGLMAGKTVLVSGAGTGLGKAIALLYARLGARLVICGRTPDKLEAAAPLFREAGAEVLIQPMSIRDPEQVRELFEKAGDTFGGIDVLVNNAGGQFAQLAIDFTPKGWQAVIDTNLNGTWYMMQEAAKAWIAAGKPGNIVNIVASVWRGRPTVAHSCAARAGVIYLSKSVAVEWAEHDIRINCVAPGAIETTAFNLYPPAGLHGFYHDANPMRHPGDVQDIAEACVYLTAPSGKYITGEVVTVDGGQQLWGDSWPGGRPDYFS